MSYVFLYVLYRNFRTQVFTKLPICYKIFTNIKCTLRVQKYGMRASVSLVISNQFFYSNEMNIIY